MEKKNILVFFPLGAAFLMPVTFLISYGWAVSLGLVEADFPYISSTGTHPPVSSFFSFMLNIIAILLAVTVWARHQQIKEHCSQRVVSKDLPGTSTIASVFGYLASLGIALVGNFQSTSSTVIHLIGAAMAFGLGTVYLWMQSWMSITLTPHACSRRVMVTRFVCSTIATLTITLTLTFSALHHTEDHDVAYWTTDDSWRRENRTNWTFHIVATSAEWVLAMTFVVVLLTLVPEFKRLSFHGVLVEYSSDRAQVREVHLTHSTHTIVSRL